MASTAMTPPSVNPARSTACPTPEKACWRKPIPRKSRPKPARACPKAPRRVLAPLTCSAMPNPIRGRAAASILILKPISATSQPVIVVPTLAPNSTHSDWPKLSRPALTKPMAATVTALDDWTSAVTMMPESRPRQRVWVEEARMRDSEGPAARRRPSLSRTMPSRKRPRPPSKEAMSSAATRNSP